MQSEINHLKSDFLCVDSTWDTDRERVMTFYFKVQPESPGQKQDIRINYSPADGRCDFTEINSMGI